MIDIPVVKSIIIATLCGTSRPYWQLIFQLRVKEITRSLIGIYWFSIGVFSRVQRRKAINLQGISKCLCKNLMKRIRQLFHLESELIANDYSVWSRSFLFVLMDCPQSATSRVVTERRFSKLLYECKITKTKSGFLLSE